MTPNNRQFLHDHLRKQLRREHPRTRTRNGRAITYTLTEVASGANIVEVQPPLPADLGPTADTSAWPLWGITGKPDRRAIHQGPHADCWVDAPLGGQADWNPVYLMNIIQPVVDAKNNLVPSLVDVYIWASNGINRVRVQAVSSSQLNQSSPDYGNWPDYYELAEAFIRRGSNLVSDLDWGFQGNTVVGMGLQIGSSVKSVAEIATAMRMGWVPLLQTPGINTAPGTVLSHDYWAWPVAQQPDMTKAIRFQGPWGPEQVYDYTDADAAKYFVLGSVQFALPGTPTLPQVKSNTVPVVPPVKPPEPPMPTTPPAVHFALSKQVVATNSEVVYASWLVSPGIADIKFQRGKGPLENAGPEGSVTIQQFQGPDFKLIVAGVVYTQTLLLLSDPTPPVTPPPTLPPDYTHSPIAAELAAHGLTLFAADFAKNNPGK